MFETPEWPLRSWPWRTAWGPVMNSFYEHHRDSIHWHYRCFDRILVNGLIQPFQQPERVVGFFNTYRQLYPATGFHRSSGYNQRRRARGKSAGPIATRDAGGPALSAINDNYLNVQQDILETFVDRGQLRKLAEPTITPTGKRIPGLKLDHPRQLALMHALVRFAHIAAGNTFSLRSIADEFQQWVNGGFFQSYHERQVTSAFVSTARIRVARERRSSRFRISQLLSAIEQAAVPCPRHWHRPATRSFFWTPARGNWI
jgi:hypothetical protein